MVTFLAIALGIGALASVVGIATKETIRRRERKHIPPPIQMIKFDDDRFESRIGTSAPNEGKPGEIVGRRAQLLKGTLEEKFRKFIQDYNAAFNNIRTKGNQLLQDRFDKVVSEEDSKARVVALGSDLGRLNKIGQQITRTMQQRGAGGIKENLKGYELLVELIFEIQNYRASFIKKYKEIKPPSPIWQEQAI
jgi:hypothetical protein